MYEIVPHLYLASYKDAKSGAKDDMFIINCTRDLPMIHTNAGGTRFYVDDNPEEFTYVMTSNLPLMVRYIDDHVSMNKDVVVHCFAGQQRSATVIAAYLMESKGLTAEEAITFIKNKKPDAFAGGVHFMESLHEFQHKI